jgi:putative SOS response-associated peptidase YedK
LSFDLYGFLTTHPNAEVGAVHPKAMPVILTTPGEIEQWMTAPAADALKLQRPPARRLVEDRGGASARTERRRHDPSPRRSGILAIPGY